MSAEHSSTVVLAKPAQSEQGSDPPGNGPEAAGDSAPESAAGLPLGTAELANLLAKGQWSGAFNDSTGATAADVNTYDGHVALALETGVLPALDSTLDLLTSSHHLFDVPALDVSSDPGDASSA